MMGRGSPAGMEGIQRPLRNEAGNDIRVGGGASSRGAGGREAAELRPTTPPRDADPNATRRAIAPPPRPIVARRRAGSVRIRSCGRFDAHLGGLALRLHELAS